MEKFEYAVIEYKGTKEQHQNVVDEYGRSGWELVTVIPIQMSTPEKLAVLYYFKRPAEQ